MHKRARRGLVYLPQEHSLLHGLTAEDNVAGVLECRGFDRVEARRRAKEVLGQLGIRHLARCLRRGFREGNSGDSRSPGVWRSSHDSCSSTSPSPE